MNTCLNHIPELRFKAFSDEWVEKKLLDYLEVSLEKNKNGFYTKKNVLSVSGECGIVNQIEFQGRSFAGASVLNYGVVRTGDVVYTKSPLNTNPYGIIKTNKGVAGIVSTLYAIYHPKEHTDPNFVQTYFELHARMNHYMHPLVNKGAKNDMKVSSENALKGFVVFPRLEEQKEIAEYFSRLDGLIRLAEEKVKALEKTKQAMLEKMFPKEGSLVPEVRFKGFAEPWVEKKLGEVTTSYSGGTPAVNVKEYYGGDIPFIRSAEINAKSTELFISKRGLKNSSAKIVNPGNILYALYGATSGEVAIAKIKGAINQAILSIIPRDEFNAPFLMYWLRKNKSSIVATYLQGGQGNLSGAIVKNLEPSFPSLPEQEKIGQYFSRLDDLIALQKQKVEKLKQLKVSLLEKMFVS